MNRVNVNRLRAPNLTFQSGQLSEQPKTLDDLERFDLKF
jgi:hypothetical protein